MRSGLVSAATAALVATVAGVGGTLPVVLAAAQAVGATPEQASSWVSGLGIATALSALLLSVRYRMPIITAWSTPGAALIASTSGVPGFRAAVGAFVLAAVLILLTAAIRPLGRLIERIPASIAAAMLGGILLRLVVAMVEHVPGAPLLVLPLIALFLVARGLVPTLASLIVLVSRRAARLVAGAGEADPVARPLPSRAGRLPAWDLATLIGLGVPLYLVTMASQNLPGFAVLRASGYQPPTQPVLAVTGAVSLGTAFLGAHTSNLAAISAALCTGPEAHPDPGAALEGRRLLRPVVGPDRAVRRLAGRPVRRAAAGAAGHRRGHGAAGLDGRAPWAARSPPIRIASPPPARSPSPPRASPCWASARPSGASCFGLAGAGRGPRAAALTQMCVAGGTRHGQALFNQMGRPS